MNEDIEIKMYTLRTDTGYWLGRIVLTSDGSFMSITDYGNYAYSWGGMGNEDIRDFILRLDIGYFASKMFNGECEISNTQKARGQAKIFAEKILPPLKEAIRQELELEKAKK